MISPSLLIGAVLADRYEIVGFRGRGNFSTVFEALDQTTGLDVALKILALSAGAEDMADFDHEGVLLKELTGASHVIDIHDSVIETVDYLLQTPDGEPHPVTLRFHVLELAECSLTTLFVDLGSLGWLDRLDLYRGAVKGTHQSDLRQIVHRDHKSENVLVVTGADTEVTAKLSDFGRGTSLGVDARYATEAYILGRGDRRFAPPELLWGLGTTDPETFKRAELYLIGSLLYEIGTGTGLTSYVFGGAARYLSEIRGLRPEQRARDYRDRMIQMRSMYEEAYSVFADEVPRPIRHDAVRLLRVLTDPDPQRRSPSRLRSSRNPTPGLQWILNRVDIMKLLLKRSAEEAHRLAELKKQRQAQTRNRHQ